MKDSQQLKKRRRKFVKKVNKPGSQKKQSSPLRDSAKKIKPFRGQKGLIKQQVSNLTVGKEANKKRFSPLQLLNIFRTHRAQHATKRIQPTTGGNSITRAVRLIDTDLKLLLIPMILYVILAILYLLNNHVIAQVLTITINPYFSSNKINPYPFVSNKLVPVITAKAAIISDADSQVTLYVKNQNLRFSMASTTKIMTAVTALQYFQKDSILTVRSAFNEGTVLGLLVGEKFYFNDILYAMLLPSANDAAQTIAQNYPGGVEAFVKKMNSIASSLHLSDTHYSDPTGLDDDNDYTTVIDMSRLAAYAIKNNLFAQVIRTKDKVISDLNYGKSYTLSNLNKLLGTEGVNGIKTGTTEGAGQVLVTSTFQNGHTYIIVVMDSTDRFSDTKALLSFIAQNVQYVFPQPFLHGN